MLQLADFQSEVNKFTVKSGLNARVTMWLHAVEQDVISRHPFWWMVQTASFATVASTATYVLDQRVDGRKISKLNDETQDDHVGLDNLARMLWRDPTPTDAGSPYAYAFEGMAHCRAQPSSASVLTIASDNSADMSKKVVVRGLDSSGIYKTHTITTNGADGTTPVAGAITMQGTSGEDQPVEIIQKESTFAGTLTVTSNSGGVTIVTIPPDDLVFSAPKIRLQSVPDAANTMRYYFYQRVRRLTSVYDTPTVPEQYQWQTLMNGVIAMGHYYNGDFDQGQIFEAKMERGIDKMIADSSAGGGIAFKRPPKRTGGLRTLRLNYDQNDDVGTP